MLVVVWCFFKWSSMMRVLESFAEVVESTNTKFISQHKHWQKVQSELNFAYNNAITIYTVYLMVILIWWFDHFYFITKFNIRQHKLIVKQSTSIFSCSPNQMPTNLHLRFNLSNVMFAKYTTYTIYCCFAVITSFTFCNNYMIMMSCN